MSEEPQPKPANNNFDSRGKFVVGNTARPANPHATKAVDGLDTESLRAEMLLVLRTGGSKKFLRALRDKDPATYAKILAQLEARATQAAAERQIVFVDVCEGTPPPAWEKPTIDDTDVTEDSGPANGQAVTVTEAADGV